MTYITGSIITAAACFPCVQRASDVLTYLGLLVAGMGAVCITEHLIFPKIGYTRYWNLYKNNDINWAALISWGLSLVFFVIMLVTNPIHQNFWFIPTFLIAMISYIILAGFMGAKEKYPEKEKEELEYERALQEYVDNQPETEPRERVTLTVKLLIYASYIMLAGMIVSGLVFAAGSMTTEQMKTVEFILTIIYFICSLTATVFARKRSVRKEEIIK